MELDESDPASEEADLELLSDVVSSPRQRQRSSSLDSSPVGEGAALPETRSPLKRSRPSASAESSARAHAAASSSAAAASVAPVVPVTDCVAMKRCDRCGCRGSAESGSAEARSRGAGFLGDTTACLFGHTGAVQLKGAYGVYRGGSLCVNCAVKSHACSHCACFQIPDERSLMTLSAPYTSSKTCIYKHPVVTFARAGSAASSANLPTKCTGCSERHGVRARTRNSELLAASIGHGTSSSCVRGAARQQQYGRRLTATMPPQTELKFCRLLQCFEAKEARGIDADELEAWTTEAAWCAFGITSKELRQNFARLRKVRSTRIGRRV